MLAPDNPSRVEEILPGDRAWKPIPPTDSPQYRELQRIHNTDGPLGQLRKKNEPLAPTVGE